MRAAGSSTVGLAALLSVTALGCGGSSALLPGSEADGLKERLGQVRSAVDARNCAAARTSLLELRADIGRLAPPVDRRLRIRLREEVVEELGPAVEQECDAPKVETTPTITTPAPTGPTGPAETTQTETTEPTETTDTTPPPTATTGTVPAPTTPPDDTTPDVPTVPDDPTQNPGGAGTGTDATPGDDGQGG